MSEPMTRENGRRDGRQAGFTLAVVLGFIAVLGILGVVAVRSVRTDITHSARDSRRIRAELAAESAAQWALLELSRRRAGCFPFTLATHDRDGVHRMSNAPSGPGSERYTGPWPLAARDLTPFPDAQISLDDDGWAVMRSTVHGRNLSAGNDEELAFKAWYPNDTTLRVTGRARVDGSQAHIEVMSILKQTPQPL
jgi:type II secretory pathway pseudopilin PulG